MKLTTILIALLHFSVMFIITKLFDIEFASFITGCLVQGLFMLLYIITGLD